MIWDAVSTYPELSGGSARRVQISPLPVALTATFKPYILEMLYNNNYYYYDDYDCHDCYDDDDDDYDD